MASKSERFVEVMSGLTAQAQEAKKNLKAVRKAQRIEKQRRKRVIKAASKLGPSELMEIAGLKSITLAELSALVQEMHVPVDAAERQVREAQRTARRAKAKAAPSGSHAPMLPLADLPLEDEIAALIPVDDDAATVAFEGDRSDQE